MNPPSPPKSARFARRLFTRRRRRPRRPCTRSSARLRRRHANNPISCLSTGRRGDASRRRRRRGNASLLHLQRGVKAWTAAAPETDRGVAGVADVAFSCSFQISRLTCSPVLESNANVRFHAQSSETRSERRWFPKRRARRSPSLYTDSRARPPTWFRRSVAARAVVPPSPAPFAYKFLASEFEVDDELDVDAEDAVLSTDEEEPEPDSADDGRRGDPKFTRHRRHRHRRRPGDPPSDVLEANGSRFARRVSTKNRFAPRSSRERTTTARRSDTVARRAPSPPSRWRRVVTIAVPSLREIGVFGPVPAASNADVAGGSRGGCVVVLANDGHSLARFETFLRSRRIGREDRDRPRGRERGRGGARGEIGDGGERSGARARDVAAKRRGDAAGEERGAHHRRTAREREAAFEKLSSPKTAETTSPSSSPSPRRAYTTTDVAVLFAETRVEDPPPAMDESRQRRPNSSTPRVVSADASSTDVVPERRSAASLRAKYGRPESSAATDAASRARETRDALVERGERLGTLQDKSARLEADAANFADLARQIRKQSERPRWF